MYSRSTGTPHVNCRWPLLDELHPDERAGVTVLPCGCVDLGQREGLRAVLRSLTRALGVEPTGRDRWRRAPYGWMLVHGGETQLLVAGVRHVHGVHHVRGLHLVESPVEAALVAWRALRAR